MTQTETTLAIPRWRITLNWPRGNDDRPICRVVSAWTADSAWRKFGSMYFRGLLPAREEYTIERE